MKSCDSCGVTGDGDHYPVCQSNPNAPASPPAGDVPAARPELSPGAAASFVDWEAVAREVATWEVKINEWYFNDIVRRHTHPAPVELAAKMRAELVHWRFDHGPMCRSCSGVEDATPAAVAALDRAAWENKRLRAALAATLGPLESLCAECGPGVRVDQDGLCETCGATCTGSWLDGHIAAVRRALGAKP